MLLNGDNRKIFIRDDVFYKIRESTVEEYRKKDLAMVRSRELCKARVSKEFDGKYYFLAKKRMVVYEDLFGEPVSEASVPDGEIIDFHMHDGRVFYLVRRLERYVGLGQEQEKLFDFQAGAYCWDGAGFYICSNKSLVRFDVVRRESKEIVGDVSVQCLAVKDEMIAYTDSANMLHFLTRKTKLSYHYHARPVGGIIITALGSLLTACSDGKLARIETRRNERAFLGSFDGNVVDFLADGPDVYVLTPFCLMVYDSKVGGVKGRIFSLPRLEYCKPLGRIECCTPEAPGKEMFEKNVKRTKVKMPYVFESEWPGGLSRTSVVGVRKDYVFIYDLERESVDRVGHFKGSICFYSSGCIVALSPRRKSRGANAKVYRIGEDGMLFSREYGAIDVSDMPEDVVLDKEKLFLHSEGNVYEVTGPGIARAVGSEKVKQIEEGEKGTFLLDSCGILNIGSGERILEDRDITSFKIVNNTLFVALARSGILRFEMKDEAVEEKLIDETNIKSIFVDGDVIVTLGLHEEGEILSRYRKDGSCWRRDGSAPVGKSMDRILHRNVCLSATNKLYRVVLE